MSTRGEKKNAVNFSNPDTLPLIRMRVSEFVGEQWPPDCSERERGNSLSLRFSRPTILGVPKTLLQPK